MEDSKGGSIKSICQCTDYFDSPPRCMPYRVVNKKSPLRSQNIKDIDISFLQKDNLSPINVSKIFLNSQNEQNQINIKYDKQTVRDAVLVKQISLKKKQTNEYGKNTKNPCQINRKSFMHLKKLQSMKEKVSKENILFKFYPSAYSKKQTSQIYKIDKVINKEKDEKQANNSMHQQQAKVISFISKNQMILHTKLIKYLSNIKENRKFHNFDDKLFQAPKKKAIMICIRKGNNSLLIKELIKRRWWLTLSQEENETSPNFVWSQLKEKQYFQNNRLGVVDGELNLHNHFPQNEYLGNKKALLYNMTHFYKSQSKNVFDFLPLTFHVHSFYDSTWRQFKKKFEENQKNRLKNIWIVKPGENSNRGKGITVHSKLDEIQKIIGFKEIGQENLNKTYIIQAYIERPFLYNKRKFDLRCYMLLVNINKSVKGYWYKEGYIRTSSYEFHLNDFNNLVHLTNDAIQNGCQNYGKYEDGNKISFAQFQKYLDSKFSGNNLNFFGDIIPKIKQIALDSIKASLQRVKGIGKNNQPVFEIFGLDYMIDENFKPWLIEINTNPCIQTNSSVIMQKIIPKMVDQALRLSLDVLFSPPQVWPNSKKHHVPYLSEGFELLYDEEKQKQKIVSENLPTYESMGLITQDEETFEEK